MVFVNPATQATLGIFCSALTTGTAAEQDIPHGLGRTPTIVFVSVADSNNAADHVVIEGTHDDTNVKIQMESGTIYKVLAM